MALTDEKGYQLATARYTYLFPRYTQGAQAIRVPVMREAIPNLRAGDWVVVSSLSWMPNLRTGRRNMVIRGQVMAVADLDCAWRRLLIEDEEPPTGYS